MMRVLEGMQADPFIGIVGQRNVLRCHSYWHETKDVICNGGVVLAVSSSDKQKWCHSRVWKNRRDVFFHKVPLRALGGYW